MTSEEKYESPATLKAEVRTLKWKLKSICKQNGKQGQTIFDLRNQVDALRATAGERSIGDYRRLLQQLRASEEENRRLREKLAAKEESE
jgi:hypothetical protein